MSYLGALQPGDVIPRSDEGFAQALHAAAVAVAAAREAGDRDAELVWRRELQRIANLHAQFTSGQAIAETQLRILDYVPSGADLALGFGGVAIPALIVLALLFAAPMRTGKR